MFIKISISKQSLLLYQKKKLVKQYPVSTSRYGVGNEENSLKTPLGLHVIAEKIGEGEDLDVVFKNRKLTKKDADIDLDSNKDFITSRILRLKGVEKKKNLGAKCDSYKRNIYIHGTNQENLIGTPSSDGCIRMKNQDIAELFSSVELDAKVIIEE